MFLFCQNLTFERLKNRAICTAILCQDACDTMNKTVMCGRIVYYIMSQPFFCFSSVKSEPTRLHPERLKSEPPQSQYSCHINIDRTTNMKSQNMKIKKKKITSPGQWEVCSHVCGWLVCFPLSAFHSYLCLTTAIYTEHTALTGTHLTVTFDSLHETPTWILSTIAFRLPREVGSEESNRRLSRDSSSRIKRSVTSISFFLSCSSSFLAPLPLFWKKAHTSLGYPLSHDELMLNVLRCHLTY